jgi:ADP-heptose:LPS heptosyltransferase
MENGFLQSLPDAPRKVVLVRGSRIGDYLCATPALRALRGALPEAEITLIALPFIRELAERSPHVDRFVPFPGFPGIAEQFFEARRVMWFFRRMQAERFDLAVQMHGSGVYSNPFTLMLGARRTVGFVRPGDPSGRLDAALPMPEGIHEIRRVLALTTFLGAPSRGEQPEFPLTGDDHAQAEQLLAGAEPPFVGVHPAARETAKRWPPECHVAVARALQRRHGGTVVLVGSEEEKQLGQQLAAEIGPRCVSLIGKTSLAVLGAVLARLAVLITNDSGPAHIAYALRRPTVTLFGGTDPRVWGPLERELHPVLVFPPAGGPTAEVSYPASHRAFPEATVERVVAAARAILRAREEITFAIDRPME